MSTFSAEESASNRPDSAARASRSGPWIALVSRTVLFAAFQGVVAVLLRSAGAPDPWSRSAGYWIFVAAAANVVTIALLSKLYRAEGRSYRELFRLETASRWKDIGLSVAALVVAGPIAMIPMRIVATALFGTYEAASEMMFRPLPMWALGVGMLFPITIAFAELPLYFGYVMPRIEKQLGNGALGLLIAAAFLGLQHATLPLILDWRFLVWRAVMFLPFALFLGLVLRWRPRLLPYLMVGHFLIDTATLAVYLSL